MPVVVPQRVEPAATLCDRPNQRRILRLVLSDQHDGAVAGRGPRVATHHHQNVLVGCVEYLLRRVEAQAVEMELLDPVRGVGCKELADRRGPRSVEVDGVAPLVVVLVGEVGRRKLAQIVARRPEMIRDHVEDHAEARRMGGIDEAPEVVRRAIQVRWGKHVHAVVAPPEAPVELGDRHDLEARDPEVGERFQFVDRGGPCSGRRERADMQLVEHLIPEHDTAPGLVAPAVRRWIDDLRWTVRAERLEPRCGIRKQALAAIQSKAIAIADRRRHTPAEVAVGFRIERCRHAGFENDVHTRHARGPHAHVRAAVGCRLRADRQPPPDVNLRPCTAGAEVVRNNR
jgi:hypothetical protein